MRILLICLVLLICSCVRYVNQPVIQEEPLYTEKEEPQKKMHMKYKFHLTDEERELNKDNSFLNYLESGGDYPTAVPQRDRTQSRVSSKQRKAVTR